MPANNPRRKRATRNPDHLRRLHVPAPSDAEIEARLEALVQPAVFAELAYYQQLGLRNRLLTLPVMVAVVLTLIWRQVAGVCELTRLLAHERVLWSQPTAVSQPALSQRLLTFPAELFERVLLAVVAQLPARAASRTRPLAPPLAALLPRFNGCYALDASTLEALFRKLASLREAPDSPLAGQITAAVDLATHLPAKLWWADDPIQKEPVLIPRLLAWLPPGSLAVFDLGYFAFPFFDQLSASERFFVTRLRAKTSFRVEQVLLERPRVRDRIVHLGLYRSNPSTYSVRLVEVYLDGAWHQYLTNVLDPQCLSVVEVVAAYAARWKIETTFLLVKRLLGLSYLWVGSVNGVQLQVYATFLFYAILIDLCDEVAEALQVPLEQVSVEMVYRGLYHYVQAVAQGYVGGAADYFAREAKGLGILKRIRAPNRPPLATQVRLALLAQTPPPEP